jgi:hypothetical protein
MKYTGSCHCGSIKFEIDSDLEKIVQCNCSICIKRNAKMIMIPKENFKLLEGSEIYPFINLIQKSLNTFFVRNVVSTLIIIENLILMAWVLI